MTKEEAKKMGATHYDKFGNYYMNFKSEWYCHDYKDSEFVLMSHSPLYTIKPL